ncbi:ribosomal protein S18-alanine N-acetyltransferase [Christensenellaceae bacterium OttesenSCG-928-M15]|nr:ribosomal protein S18-alanine N-acetyltransferase [Christensenellaceae bacterium OttesenSCG-928-M15]
MEHSVVFRAMNKADVPGVARIEKTCFRSPWTERMLKNELKNSAAHYYVLELAGELVGYLGMWIIFDEAHITNVAVMPDHRRKGYGKLQMVNGMKEALALGATQMTLEVRESNDGAQTLYYGLDFQLAGRRKKYYTDTGEDAFILWNEDIEATVLKM